MSRLETSPHPLIDIGANLTHDSFDNDREAVMERAVTAGVTRMVITGASENGSQKAADLAAAWPERLRSTAGVHPHLARDYTKGTADSLRELLARPEVVAVGECGLDFFRNFSDPKDQVAAFESQLEIACETGHPVFLHQRDAHWRFLEVLTPVLPDISRAVVHCFTGSREELEECIELNLYVGVTGWICDERRGTHLREIVSLIPNDRIMIETDAPYLMPRDLNLNPKPSTRRNEPRWLPHVLAAVAECRGETPEALAKLTTANAEHFFGW
jgi:TatD DNase family protein